MAEHPPIRMLKATFHVERALEQLADHPELWNQHTHRTQGYGTPHRAIDDIWVRYNDFSKYIGDRSFFADEHDSVWYPGAEMIPAVVDLVMDLMGEVRGERLGGVLITRIPAGGQVEPHIDQGWHARYYDKFCIQLMGNPEQAFCFHGHSLSALPGQVYTFDNSREHWVTNSSKEVRMSLIVCIKGAHHVEFD
jgi:hypothetical protein